MLRKIRIALATVCFAGLTLLFLDFTGVLQGYLGFLAKIQLWPAVMALNIGVIVALALLTLLFGRVYCSVICPLGVYQDVVSHASKSRKGHKNAFKYAKESKWLRYSLAAVFVLAAIFGVQALVAALEPYSNFGRIAQNIVQPVYIGVNNLLALVAEHFESYAFYSREVWLRSLPTLIFAVAMLVLVTVLAWRNGRDYCNKICPVGTVLSFLSRFAAFKPVIDQSKCGGCRKCEKNCKASCIDIDTKSIDYSRCVDCMNCIGNCKKDAISYKFAWGKCALKATESATDKATESASNSATATATKNASASATKPDQAKRAFLTGAVIATASLAADSLKAQSKAVADEAPDGKKLDGGFAEILPKQTPERTRPLTPPGSDSIKDFYRRCTACQLCVAQCPNNVLRPSKSLEHFMQPEMDFSKGYCRPECVGCSQVCPAGAIKKITPEEKTTYKVGLAKVNLDLCIPNTVGDSCGNCARHCPAGAIMMIRKNPQDKDSVRIPAIRDERCIGCGACENLCPSRPLSAITVDGVEDHKRN